MEDVKTIYEIESDRKTLFGSNDFLTAKCCFKRNIQNIEQMSPRPNSLFLVEKQYSGEILLNKRILAIYSEITESTIFKDC